MCETKTIVSRFKSEEAGVAEQQTMRVYLRVRPFSKEELSDHEDQVKLNLMTNLLIYDFGGKAPHFSSF